MSASDGQWELGVCVWGDSFEDYDQYARLGSAYSFVSSGNQSVVLDSTIPTSSDYRKYPFCLRERLSQRDSAGGIIPNPSYVHGPEILVGPSTNEAYEGSVERASIASFTNGFTPVLVRNQDQTHIAVPYSTYEANDPILIRTLPHGWTPISAFENEYYAVMPINRYDNRVAQEKIRAAYEENMIGRLNIDSALAYQYERQRGVRLVNNSTQNRANQAIYALTPVNSMDARIRRWRTSWYYRLSRAYMASGADMSEPSGLITIKGATANGIEISSVGSEKTANTSSTVGYSAGQEGWTFGSSLFSCYGLSSLDGSTNTWNFISGSNNPNSSPMNRLNRLRIEIALTRGVNTAFDVDDLVVEHAHGTSREDEGFLTLGYPEQDSLTWQYREAEEGRVVTSNNRLRMSYNTTNNTVKHILSAYFEHADAQLYHDVMRMIQWQKQGNLLCLRTYHPALPNVMIGYLRVLRTENRLWSLNQESFQIQFEEA